MAEDDPQEPSDALAPTIRSESVPIRRDFHGRIVAGSGPLNPTGRPANPLKPLILKKLRESGEELIAKLLEQAQSGNVHAARFLAEYSIGKPPAAEEDREAAVEAGNMRGMLLAVLGIKEP